LSYAGKDFASAVAEFVSEYGITHIILGRTQRPWYRRWFGQSPLDRLLRTVRGVDIIIVDSICP
jgi:two-component system sensor histidine kinase KdpD